MWPFRKRADPEPENTEETESSEDSLLMALLSDEAVTREQAMNVPAFAACVNKIAEAVSTIPIRLYRSNGEELEEVKKDPRVRMLNAETGDTLDGVQFKRALCRDYLLGKGGYAFINRHGNQVRSLNYVKESEISFIYNTDPIFKDYDIMVQGERYHPSDFIKVLRNSEDGRSGKSIVSENSEVLGVAYHALRYEKVLVKTGGNKKGFITSENKISDGAIERIKKAWKRLYQNNTENVVVLNAGMDFKESSNTSVEMQLNENKKANSDEICKICNMPPPMITGKATEEDKTNFVQYCLNPILEEFVCALNRDLLLEREKGSYFFAADTSELTKGDIEKRFRAYELASKNGFMQIDEIRMKENFPPLGLKFIRLGLQDVLHDPETGAFYIPNMNSSGGMKQSDPRKEGETDEDRDQERQGNH